MKFKYLNLLLIVVMVLSLNLALGTTDAFAGSASAPQAQGPARTPTFTHPTRNYAAEITLPSSPAVIAEAMDINAPDILSASFNGSDERGAGIGLTPLSESFPTGGTTFVILSTGLAESADDPNDVGNLSFELYGLNNSQGNDLTQLALRLRVPNNMNCASFDFAYFSEEFPEFVGSQYNDAFTAEFGGTNLSIVGNQVVAPLNFAFDTSGNVISVNTVFGVTLVTNTTYDGGTPLLRAHTAVTPGSVVDFVFSVQDLGDSIYDSAVFLDKFFWSNDSQCGGSAQADKDGDGLLDIWETQGLSTEYGVVPLPAMGANPDRKDIFVEIDYMVEPGSCLPVVGCILGHSHQPKADAIAKIVQSFANAPVSNPDGITGINLHVDYGPDSEMNPVTHAKWGNLSQSNSLPHDDQLGSTTNDNYDLTEFNSIREANFSKARAAVFHYNVWAHQLGGLGSTSGVSRGAPASDFVVSLGGSWILGVGSTNEQAGTFMHELGHNLGLGHGGGDDVNYKPNYLSVMNYSFQMKGLKINLQDGHFDYSRFTLPDLNENSLDETVGLNSGSQADNYGTRYFCGVNDAKVVNHVNEPINWNCDGDKTDTDVQENVNEGDTEVHDQEFGILKSHDDWANLVYTGGAIGQPGAEPELPIEVIVNELTQEQNAILNPITFEDVPSDYWAYDFIERLYAAGITGGCGTNPMRYCPEDTVTRAQMAVFLERGIHGASYVPPAVGAGTGFGDVSPSYWSAAFIKQLVTDGITVGCGSGNYCPEQPVTRAQMAVFLLRSKHGGSYVPPGVGGGTDFGDVPANYWSAAWIKQLVTEGITSGCGGGNYCPESPVTRAQMAVFLVRTFGLP
jgi:hypothetical protein